MNLELFRSSDAHDGLKDSDADEPECDWLRRSAPFAELTSLPALELPPSSDDLLIAGADNLLTALEVYEILRRFYKSIRLSPFRFEDFCAALSTHEHPRLLASVHVCLLKACVQDDQDQDVQYLAMDQRESLNIMLHLVDSMTYAEVLRQYVESFGSEAPGEIVDILEKADYPYVHYELRLKGCSPSE